MVQDIYLTFDDGPNHEMDNILDILKTKTFWQNLI
ncbi:polysaccharide deacetylase family protein [Fictibacillus enclensis]